MEAVVNGVKIDSSTELKFKPNPKRPGFKAHARYEQYQTATTLEEYLDLADPKYAKADLRYDMEHGHIEVVESEETEELEV